MTDAPLQPKEIESELGRVLGRRPPNGFRTFPAPGVVGYRCPKCLGSDERLTWSEYQDCLWCATCQADWPMLVCCPDPVAATAIFLHSIDQRVNRKPVGEALTDIQGKAYTVNQLLILDSWDSEVKENNGHDVLIERRRQADDGSIKWLVMWGSSVLTKQGQWVRDPSPSWRTEEHYQATRYETLDEALASAHRALPEIKEWMAQRLAEFKKEHSA